MDTPWTLCGLFTLSISWDLFRTEEAIEVQSITRSEIVKFKTVQLLPLFLTMMSVQVVVALVSLLIVRIAD